MTAHEAQHEHDERHGEEGGARSPGSRPPHRHHHDHHDHHDHQHRHELGRSRGERSWDGPEGRRRGPWGARRWDGAETDGRDGLHRSIQALLGAARQVEMAGDDAVVQASRAVLADAARAVYGLLATSPAQPPVG